MDVQPASGFTNHAASNDLHPGLLLLRSLLEASLHPLDTPSTRDGRRSLLDLLRRWCRQPGPVLLLTAE